MIRAAVVWVRSLGIRRFVLLVRAGYRVDGDGRFVR